MNIVLDANPKHKISMYKFTSESYRRRNKYSLHENAINKGR